MLFSPRLRKIAAAEAGVRVVHVIGDSVVYGTGLTPEQAFPLQLEEALNQDFPEDLFCCLNLAHEGRNMWNALFLYEAAHANDPCDLLVFSVCDNDNEYMCTAGVDYKEDPTKRIYWNHPLLRENLDKAFTRLAQVAKKKDIPCLVQFYENYIKDYEPIGDILAELCAKNGLSYLNLTRKHYEMYKLEFNDARVSRADGHPGARFNALAGRIASDHLRAQGILKPGIYEKDVFNRLRSATQDMLDAGRHCQDVFRWALQTAKIKGVALPRVAKNRVERQEGREKGTRLSVELQESWLLWQRNIWRAGVTGRLLPLIQSRNDIFYELKQVFILLQESLGVFAWQESETECHELAAYLQNAFARFECKAYQARNEKKIIDVLGGSPSLPTLREHVGRAIEELGALSDQFRESPSCAAAPFSVQDSCFMHNASLVIELLDEVRDVSRFICRTFDEVEAKKTGTAGFSEAGNKFFYNLMYDLVLSLWFVIKLVKENGSVLLAKNPIIGIDAFVTITLEKPDAKPFIANGLHVLCRPRLPALLNPHEDMQHLIGDEPEHVYKIRLPFFFEASLKFRIYGKEPTLYGIKIRKVELCPAFAEPTMAQLEGQITIFGEGSLRVEIPEARITL